MHDLPSVFLQHALLPPGKALGHREGISATAAGITGKEKINAPTLIRVLK